MDLTNKHINELKIIYKEKEGKELSDEEARDAAYRLTRLVEILLELVMKDAERKKRLKKEPKGFHLEGTYNCILCHRTITDEEIWYDKDGQKCLVCQKAIDEEVVPPFVCINRDSFFLMWEMKSDFGLAHQTVKKFMREGKLVARIIITP